MTELPSRLRTACRLLYAIAVVMVVYGLVYLSYPRLLPYHQTYIEIPFEDLDPRVQSLFLLIYRGVGAAMIAFGLTEWMIVRGFLRKRSRWAVYTIGLGNAAVLLPLVFVIRQVGDHAPWWGVAALFLVVLAAVVLALPHTE